MPLNLQDLLRDLKRNWDIILAVLLALFAYVDWLGRPLQRLFGTLGAAA